MARDRQCKPCKGISKYNGEPCKGWAVWGDEYCPHHGGIPSPIRPTLSDHRDMTEKGGVRCHARKLSGGQCTMWACKGQLVCKRHGGSTPQARRAAQLRISDENARKELLRLGDIAPVTNQLAELKALAGEVLAWKNICRDKIMALKDEEWRYEGHLHGEMLRSEVLLFERALDRAATILLGLARAEIDERLVQIEQQKADMVASALAVALEAAGVTGEPANMARRAFAKRLIVAKGELTAVPSPS